jgi:protease-4
MSEHIKDDGEGRFVANPTAGNWERETLEKLVFATIKERRAARRWSIFFRLAFLAAVVVGLWTYLGLSFGGDHKTLAQKHYLF